MRSVGWFWALRREILTVFNTVRHPDTPAKAKWVALAALVYLVSPIDLLPDVLPLMGWVDELIVIPLLVQQALRLTPQAIVEASRTRAEARLRSIDPMGRRVIRVGLLLLASGVAVGLTACVVAVQAAG